MLFRSRLRRWNFGYFILGLISTVCLASAISGPKFPSSSSFLSSLDHFNPLDQRTIELFFAVNSTYWDGKGPIIFNIGGELADGRPNLAVASPLAIEFSGLDVQLAHRFYGDSCCGDGVTDLSPENLVYLSVFQALEDFALFKDWFSATYQVNPSTKWILVGCSYPGVLSAWLRGKYPDLFDAAISGCAPVQNEPFWTHYDKSITATLKSHSTQCADSVRSAGLAAYNMSQTSSGLKQLTKMTQACTPIKTSLDAGSIGLQLLMPLFFNVQYNSYITGYPLGTFCDSFNETKSGEDALEVLIANYMQLYYPDHKNGECVELDVRKAFSIFPGLPGVGLENRSLSNQARKWYWQMCSEIGELHTSNYWGAAASDTSFSASPLVSPSWYTDLCNALFFSDDNSPPPLIPAVNSTHNLVTLFGGNTSVASDILYIQGLQDPVSSLAPFTMTVSSSPVSSYTGAGHCAYDYPPNDAEDPSIQLVRSNITMFVKEHL